MTWRRPHCILSVPKGLIRKMRTNFLACTGFKLRGWIQTEYNEDMFCDEAVETPEQVAQSIQG